MTIQEETSMSAHEVIDPVCGMTIAASGDITREHEGAVYHFCSEGCAIRFDADAIAYVAAAFAAASRLFSRRDL